MFKSPHYHIKWLPSGKLDWQPFTTQDDAEQMARELRLGEEDYWIEPIEGECEACADLNPRNASRSGQKEEER